MNLAKEVATNPCLLVKDSKSSNIKFLMDGFVGDLLPADTYLMLNNV
jgi:hypothetical protein